MGLDADKRKTLVSVKNISFSYNRNPVLEDVTLSIYPGDFLAVLGPNGSGKTTLVKIILGLLKPDKGEIFLMEKPAQEFKEHWKIGYVPQKVTHFDPHFPASVKEVVSMGCLAAKNAGSPGRRMEEEELIQSALKKVKMETHANSQIGYLSGGQQQRVFIARAIVNQPEILFLDEPTTGVDMETQEKFYDMLKNLNNSQNMTIVLITHETGMVNKHVKQVACLNRKLVYHGTHEEFCRSEEFRKRLDEGHHVISHKH